MLEGLLQAAVWFDGYLESNNHIDANQSEELVNMVVNSIVDDLLTFLRKMELSVFSGNSFKRELIECYVSIRKKASLKKHRAKPYINMQMQKMPTEYLKSLRSISLNE